MYNNAGTAGAASGMAATGLTGNVLWMFLTAFALIALGLAALRTVPRREG